MRRKRKVKNALDEQDANKINQSVVMEPVEVDTNVSYEFEGNYFQFLNEENRDGYRLMTIRDNVADKEYAIIKPSSQDGYYIISREGKSSSAILMLKEISSGTV